MEARAGNSDEATRLFARASRKRGTRAGADGATWQARALQLRAEGKVQQARECFETGVRVEQRHVPLYHAWGQLELEQSNVSAARDVFQRGIWASRNARETSSLWTAWALLEERAGDVEQARAYLREGLRRDQYAVDVRIIWASLEARAGDLAAARQLFEGAVRIDPRNAQLWSAYEEMERACGSTVAAERVWQRGEGALALPAADARSSGGGLPLPTNGLQDAAKGAAEWLANQQQQQQQQQQQGQGTGRALSAVEEAYGLGESGR
jgi:tetratricopeptide (TPR) repeat protein